MISASTVLKDEVSADESDDGGSTDGATDADDGDPRERSLDDIIDAYAE
jgi:hypothetical protein